jgi:dethiobiotin synthetase
MSFIIAGIHTGIGKTICSAILTEALQWDYWKPVQAGSLEDTDSMFVQHNISNTKSKIHPEAYRLKIAASPHYAAEQEHRQIILNDMKLPVTSNEIIVETAGGLLSPLSDTLSNLDLIKHLKLPVILVSNDYLGSINHTLLTFELLKQHKIIIQGIIFSGKEVPSSRAIILKKTNLPLLLSIPFFENITPKAITDFASHIKVDLIKRLHDTSGKR